MNDNTLSVINKLYLNKNCFGFLGVLVFVVYLLLSVTVMFITLVTRIITSRIYQDTTRVPVLEG